MTNILLITATITPPPGVPALARVDPKDRLLDYQAAFDFYLTLVGRGVDAIVFCENSSSDVSSLAAAADAAGVRDRVEFVVFNGLDYPAAYGRSYGEFRLVRHAMSESRIIRSHREAVIWKVTGRYVVRNVGALIARRPDCDLYANCRDFPEPCMDFFLYAFNMTGYQSILRDFEDNVREDLTGGPGELAGRKLLDQRLSRARVARRFRSVPRVEGIRGYDNSQYMTAKGALKFWARSAAVKLAPWVWI